MPSSGSLSGGEQVTLAMCRIRRKSALAKLEAARDSGGEKKTRNLVSSRHQSGKGLLQLLAGARGCMQDASLDATQRTSRNKTSKQRVGLRSARDDVCLTIQASQESSRRALVPPQTPLYRSPKLGLK